MKRLYLMLFLFTLYSCSIKTKNIHPTCLIKYDSLFKDADTSKFELLKYPNENLFEVLDKRTKSGECGIFKFDSTGILRYYAFLQDRNNNTSFAIEYDSIGNRKRDTDGEVVQWTFQTPKADSIVRLTFYLCALDNNYNDIKIEAGDFRQENVVLYETIFMKIIGANIEFPSNKLSQTRKIYLTGGRQDKCSKAIGAFIDSTTVP